MIFEDIPMLLLDGLMVAGVFQVPKILEGGISGSSLFTQLGTSFLSVSLTYMGLKF